MTRELDLFVTGMVRSGTTLLEKLLCNHPSLSVLSQPLPYLWVGVKRRFLETLGEKDALPLGPLFPEARYRPEDFHRFLREHRVPAADLEQWLEAMRGYSGQGTRFDPPEGWRERSDGRPFAELLRFWHRALAHRAGALGFGSKEVRCEEFLPHLLEEGFHALLILRDPRDVLASIRGGAGAAYVGAPRPLLHEIRSWRRSATYALALADHPRFHLVRYEDLVREPQAELERLRTRLGLERFPALGDELRDQRGRPWAANSSFGRRPGIASGSVGSHRQVLAPREVAYIEALCGPELRAFGYELSLPAPRPERIDEAVERGPLRRDDVPPDLGQRPEERRLEHRRLAVLEGAPAAEAELVALFRFPRVARRLAEAARPGAPRAGSA